QRRTNVPIENRDLTVGTKLVGKYRGTHHSAMVSAGEGGKLVFTLDDGRRYKSPSAAASAIMGGTAANGWRWWSVEGDVRAPDSTKAEKPKKAPEPATDKSRKIVRRVANQKGVPEGGVRFFCDACM